MNIKNVGAPILIIGLSIAFAIVVVGVYITKGKSKFWISKKLLIGSFLLSLTSVVNHSCITTCYDNGQPNLIVLDSTDHSSTIIININEKTKLTGIIYARESKEFSFNVTNLLKTDTFQVGNIIPSDGKFDENTEDFYIELSKDLPANEYILNLYDRKQTEQVNLVSAYRLIVQHED